MKKLLLGLLSLLAVNITHTMSDIQFSYAYEEAALKDVNKLIPLCKAILNTEKEVLEEKMAATPCHKTAAYSLLAGVLAMSIASCIPVTGIVLSWGACAQLCGTAGLCVGIEHSMDANNKVRYEQVKTHLAELDTMKVSLHELKQMMVTQ